MEIKLINIVILFFFAVIVGLRNMKLTKMITRERYLKKFKESSLKLTALFFLLGYFLVFTEIIKDLPLITFSLFLILQILILFKLLENFLK